MKLADRLFEIPEDVAIQGNTTYESYRLGLKWTAVGAVVVLGGLAFNAVTGSEAGRDIAAAGGLVLWAGGAQMALNTDQLRQQDM
jgi:hypothetical protein